MVDQPPKRSNQDWLDALNGEAGPSSRAVEDLSLYLRRVMAKVFRGRFQAEDLGELVQEGLARVIKSLGSFRGESAFTTWAAGVATRVGFTELRRRAARERTGDAFGDLQEQLRFLPTEEPSPDESATQRDLVRALRHAIATELSDRQRSAILAELRGLPTIEIAERLGTNQNALYKLIHDARKKLKTALDEAGFRADSLHGYSSEVR